MEDENNLLIINDNVDDYEDENVTPDGQEEPSGDVEDLIPLCVKHAKGPQINTATFGYDIEQMTKRPWSQPGAKTSDYFNYGFNETSWRLYCAMQAEGEASLLAKADQMLQKLKVAGYQPGVGRGLGGEGVDGQGYDGDMTGYDDRHGGAVYRGGQPVQQQQQQPPPQQQLSSNYKTKLCQRYLEGTCTRGSNCNYAHGEAELRTPNQMDMSGSGGGGGGGAQSSAAQFENYYNMPMYNPGSGLPPMEGYRAQNKRYRQE